ncbi:STAS domain-containing protein [Streptomyces exfoliatus]|uniref:STAS domain-containing protein n=1 Tax=Streptomyces exfoliatus TaxID=1905 RepID=UPI003C2FC8B2
MADVSAGTLLPVPPWSARSAGPGGRAAGRTTGGRLDLMGTFDTTGATDTTGAAGTTDTTDTTDTTGTTGTTDASGTTAASGTTVVGRTVITARGELDIDTGPALRGEIAEALERNHGVVVDLSGVEFMDCAGLGALVAALHEAERHGHPLTLRSPNRQVSRLLRLTGAHERLRVEPSSRSGGSTADVRTGGRHRR